MSYSPTTPTEYDKSSLERFAFFDEHSLLHPEMASNASDPISLDYPLGFDLSSSTAAPAVMPDDPIVSSNLPTPDSELGPSNATTTQHTGGRGNVCGPAHSANTNTPSPVMQHHHHHNSSNPSSSPNQLRHSQHIDHQHSSIPSAPEWMRRASGMNEPAPSNLLGRTGFTSQPSNAPASTWPEWPSSGPNVQVMGSQWESPSVLTGTNSGQGTGADGQQEQYKEQQDSQLHQLIDSLMHGHPYADTSNHTQAQALQRQQHQQTSSTGPHRSHVRSLSHSTTPPTPPLAVDLSPSLPNDNDSTTSTDFFSGVGPFGFSQSASGYYHNDSHGGRVHVQIPNHVGPYGTSRQTPFATASADIQALLERQKTLSPPLSLNLLGTTTTNRPYARKHVRNPPYRRKLSQAGSISTTSPPSSRQTSISSTGRLAESTTVDGLGGTPASFTGQYDEYTYAPSSWSYEMHMPAQAYHDIGSMPLGPRASAARVSGVYQRYESAISGGIAPSWASSQQADAQVSRSTITRTSPQPPPSNINRDTIARASNTASVTANVTATHHSTSTAARVVEGDKVVSLPPSIVEPTIPLEVRLESLPRDKRAMFERACGPRWSAARDANASTRAVDDVTTTVNAPIVEAIYALLSSEQLAKQMEIPDDLVEPLLARVPLPKAVAKRGSRGGAAGYTCLWAGCNKQLIKRLDHAKNHIREHCKSKPFACGGPTTQGAVMGGRGCGQKFLRIDDLKRHQKSHCSVLKSGPTRRPRAVRGVYHDEDDEEHDSDDSPLKGDDDDEYRPTEPRLYPLPTHADPDASSPAATSDQAPMAKATTTREMVHRVRGEKQRAAAKQALAAVSAAAAYLVDEGSSDAGGSSPDTMTSGTRASPVDLGRLQTSHVRGGAASTLPNALPSSSAAMLAANSRFLSPTYPTTQVATARDVHDSIKLDDLVEMDGADLDVFGLEHQKVWLGCGALMASCSSRLIVVPVRAATVRPHLLFFLTSLILVVIFDILCRVHDVLEIGAGGRVGGVSECRTRTRLRGEDRAVRMDRM